MLIPTTCHKGVRTNVAALWNYVYWVISGTIDVYLWSSKDETIPPTGRRPVAALHQDVPAHDLCPHAAWYSRNGTSVVWIVCLCVSIHVSAPRARRYVWFWASGGAKFPKVGDSLPRTPVENLMPLALSSSEKSETIQNYKHTNKKQTDKQVRRWGLTYIHTCRPTSTHRTIFHEWRISSVTFVVCLPLWNYTSRCLANSSDFGLLGEQSSAKREIPCPGLPWTTVQYLTPLALSSLEKSVTVQTKKQTVTDISTPCV